MLLLAWFAWPVGWCGCWRWFFVCWAAGGGARAIVGLLGFVGVVRRCEKNDSKKGHKLDAHLMARRAGVPFVGCVFDGWCVGVQIVRGARWCWCGAWWRCCLGVANQCRLKNGSFMATGSSVAALRLSISPFRKSILAVNLSICAACDFDSMRQR